MNTKMMRLAFTGKCGGFGANSASAEARSVAPAARFGAVWPIKPAKATRPKPAPAFLTASRRVNDESLEHIREFGEMKSAIGLHSCRTYLRYRNSAASK